MTGEEARLELLKTAEQKVTVDNAFGSIIPKSVLAYVLELVHMKKTLGKSAPYDNKAIAEEAHRVLKGLENKYGR